MRRRVARAKHDEVVGLFFRERKRRLDAEKLSEEKDATISQLQALVQHHRDQKADAPLDYPKPGPVEVELRKQLALRDKTITVFVEERLELIRINDVLNQQLRDKAEALAEATTDTTPTVTYDGRPA
ncbi:hypothetical protein MQE23_08715 [Streptomyces sp. HP-A2021]|uniref:hypothetical protein n=1 Tax=Streptomyces sp. HP-A2021 TaxID=2927875 RepID=UPI001FB04A72|nr:hypothetical protein [Streptomyces sp. HP-A2021]UOB09133.1 hypothetical protein MQE23_08715 [Streptomyces sp. HP-A2021]